VNYSLFVELLWKSKVKTTGDDTRKTMTTETAETNLLAIKIADATCCIRFDTSADRFA
jgi:hypothetical protein